MQKSGVAVTKMSNKDQEDTSKQSKAPSEQSGTQCLISAAVAEDHEKLEKLVLKTETESPLVEGPATISTVIENESINLPTRMCLDTGASHNYMFDKVATKARLTIQPSKLRTIQPGVPSSRP